MSDIPAPPDHPQPPLAPIPPAKPRLSKQQKKDIMWLVAFVATCGMILLLTVILLMRVLRRRLREMEARKKREEMPDIWKAGGQRLTEQMGGRAAGDKVNPFDAPGDGGTNDDENEAEDEDENKNDGKP